MRALSPRGAFALTQTKYRGGWSLQLTLTAAAQG